MKRIKDMPVSDRPQEKLLTKGRQNLTDAELIAILLGTGSAKQNAVSVAETFLRKFPLNTLSKASFTNGDKISGIGRVKAARILASIELGERMFAPVVFTKSIVRTTEDALAQLKGIVGKKQEHVIVLYLNARYELLQKETLAMGNLNTALIEPKEIFHYAVTSPCHAIIVGHNHPSGDPNPSDADISFTKRIHEAGEIMGITLLDHLIVTATNYFSFRDGKSSERY